MREALTLAQSRGLDLVEVSPTARPPVCRIMDYGKFKYEQNRRARKAKKKQHQMQLKEIKMRPKIDEHDYDFKVNHARDFLGGRDKVKVTVTFRGREMAHQEIGHKLIQRVLADLADDLDGRISAALRGPHAVRGPDAQGAATTAAKPPQSRTETGAGGEAGHGCRPKAASAAKTTREKAADSAAG